jgi:glycerate 2-kinase
MFDAAVAAAQPERCIPPHLPEPPKGRLLVIGAGKASAAMACAVEDHWSGPLEGLVVTRYDHALPCQRIEVVEAGHPMPDANGEAAARQILALAQSATDKDLLLCLISGGGSALLALPAPGLTLVDKMAVTRRLLACGATISEINTVRKHLSAIKGGRLAAAAWPAPLLTLAISDVPGDDPAIIASGPTVADPSTFAEAAAVLSRYGIDPPAAVVRHLAAAEDESPKPGDPRLAGSRYVLVATPGLSLAAAAEQSRGEGYEADVLGDALEGEAQNLGAAHADLLRRTPRGRVLISGGETTVALGKSGGRGGRNGEYLLALAVALGETDGTYGIACDTDGIDGTEDNAGAIITPDTLVRARARGLDARVYLANHDSYGFFSALGDLVMTGPTHTNVNDFRALLQP